MAQQIEYPELPHTNNPPNPDLGHPSIVFRIASAVAHCFRTMGHWFELLFRHQEPTARQFFTLKMNIFSKMEIVRIIEEIPAAEREEVTRNARRLITSDMSIKDIRDMILCVQHLPPQEREAIIDLVLSVYPEPANTTYIKNLIATIQEIPADQRASHILLYKKPPLPQTMNAPMRTEVPW